MPSTASNASSRAHRRRSSCWWVARTSGSTRWPQPQSQPSRPEPTIIRADSDKAMISCGRGLDERARHSQCRVMFIAHAPSGYILSVSILKRMRRVPVSSRAAMVACVAGAVAPDIDLLYFHLIDHRQTLHHKYFSHWPVTWLVLTVAAAALNRQAARSENASPAARRLRAA